MFGKQMCFIYLQDEDLTISICRIVLAEIFQENSFKSKMIKKIIEAFFLKQNSLFQFNKDYTIMQV
jgi:hypothetical protein